MSEYALHPDALADIDKIWEYIPNDSVGGADRAIEAIFENIAQLMDGQRSPRTRSAPLAPAGFGSL